LSQLPPLPSDAAVFAGALRAAAAAGKTTPLTITSASEAITPVFLNLSRTRGPSGEFVVNSGLT
jgi:hypothetical protein